MKSSNKGSVLIISLIIMSIAIALTIFTIKITKEIINSYKLILDKLEAKITAEAEIEKLKFMFLTSNFKSYKTIFLNKIDNNYPDEIILDGREYKIKDKLTLSVLDQSAKANLYYLTDETSLRPILVKLLGEKEGVKLTNTYLDWVDKDNLVRNGGAELSYYKNIAGTLYTPRNNAFLQDIEELLNIKGYTRDIYKKLKQYISLSYLGGDLNLFLADLNLLNNLKYIDRTKIEKIKNLKQTGRLEDLEKFLNTDPSLSEIFTMEPSKILEIKLKVTSGKAVEKIYCIIDFKELNTTPYVIYKYKE